MKVGTDGVLLGAWARVENACRILDVGTGTGIIALMAAQRNQAAQILAIDIDPQAVDQAKENAGRSIFSQKISIAQHSLHEFASINREPFDVILCNPPFFENSLKPPARQRSMARHSESLPLEELLACAKVLLSEKGNISLILPSDRLQKAEAVCEKLSLFITRKTFVKPLPESQPKRVLLEISPEFKIPEEEKIVIELLRHKYSDEYIRLTKDFYLKM